MLVVLTGALTLGTLAFTSVPARAAITHEFLPEPSKQLSKEVPAKGPHGEEVSTPGPLLLDGSSMTVDSGHLWIAELAGINNGSLFFRVDEYNASTGSFISQLAHAEEPSLSFGENGIAVGHAAGEAQVYLGELIENTEAAVAVFDEAGVQKTWTGTGTPAHSFARIGDVAVDNSSDSLDEHKGDVYVSIPSQGVIDIFHPEADGEEHYVGQITTGQIAGFPPGEAFEPKKLAVNEANGDLIIQNGKTIDIVEPGALGEYALASTIIGPSGASFGEIFNLAVDGLSGEIYISERSFRSSSVEVFVDQFSSTGAYLGRLDGAGTPAGDFAEVTSLAVDQESHDLYVGDARGNFGAMDVFGPDVVVPDVTITEPVSGLTPASVTLNGTVNPDEAGEASCEFEYGTSESYGGRAPCSATVGEGKAAVAVQSVSITGLQPDTTYHYRLDATNVADGQTNVGEAPADRGEFKTPGPNISEESASNVAASSVTLEATIDPDNAPTTYYFQYGTSVGYGTDVPLAPGAAIGSAAGAMDVAPQHLDGLLAGTLYHYRVVAVSELAPGHVEEFDGPDHTFTTQTPGAFALPDARQWQLVSPPNKLGGVLFGIGANVIQASAAGDAISYIANAPTEAAAPSYAGDGQVLSTRGAAGWSSRDIAPPHQYATGEAIGADEEYSLFSTDLSTAVVQPHGLFTPQISAEASEQTPFLRTLGACASSCYRPLVTGAAGFANVPPGTHFGEEQNCDEVGGQTGVCGPRVLGASPDASHVVLDSVAPLVAGAPTGNIASGAIIGSLYEWSAGRLQLISVLPKSGAPAQTESFPTLGAAEGHLGTAISTDGSHVVWSDGGNRHLYLSDTATEVTESVQLDAAEPGCGSCLGGGGRFQAASADGSRVFFTDKQALTKDSGAHNSSPFAADLYECQIVKDAEGLKCDLTDLTPEGVSGEPADVQGDVLGASGDGSSVYFVADGALARNSVDNGAGEAARVGQPNLYLSHEGAITFVATLSGEDETDWLADQTHVPAQPVRVSPNGQWLAFMSARSLTGYDNHDAASGQPDAEVYLYGAGAGRLTCASCDPTGARPVGVRYERLAATDGEKFGDGLVAPSGGEWQNKGWVAALLPLATQFAGGSSAYQGRYLSNEGRLFFNDLDALAPQDVNGNWDVYEHEPVGVGSCSPTAAGFDARAGACLGLISSGTSGRESAFLDASESGGDVFFLTSAKLAPQDVDTARDVYDAHECSAEVPCFSSPPLPAPACDGDACQSPVEAPNDATPGSLTFNGAGNLVPAIVPKPAVKPRAAAQIKAEKLAKALRACHSKQNRQKRQSCEKQARKRYGVTPKAKKSTPKTNRRAK
jgi:hypothetical protein